METRCAVSSFFTCSRIQNASGSAFLHKHSNSPAVQTARKSNHSNLDLRTGLITCGGMKRSSVWTGVSFYNGVNNPGVKIKPLTTISVYIKQVWKNYACTCLYVKWRRRYSDRSTSQPYVVSTSMFCHFTRTLFDSTALVCTWCFFADAEYWKQMRKKKKLWSIIRD